MPYIGFHNKEVSFKIVYYGPGMSGKTTNLVHIHKNLRPDRKGEMVMLDTDEERTLFFDFFPLELGQVEGFSVRFNMYTVPGQSYYEASRKLVLDSADGVVFVADSRAERLQENLDAYAQLLEQLESLGMDPHSFPVVLQYNKRDCGNLIPIGTLESKFKLNGIPVFESVAQTGKGVMETVRKVTQMVVTKFEI
jgi:signal recognition particle receptor subunit beta